jgi:hypothetical protein
MQIWLRCIPGLGSHLQNPILSGQANASFAAMRRQIPSGFSPRAKCHEALMSYRTCAQWLFKNQWLSNLSALELETL